MVSNPRRGLLRRAINRCNATPPEHRSLERLHELLKCPIAVYDSRETKSTIGVGTLVPRDGTGHGERLFHPTYGEDRPPKAEKVKYFLKDFMTVSH